MDAAFEQEFKKGEVSGIRLFCTLPEALVESLKSDLDHLEDLRDANENEGRN